MKNQVRKMAHTKLWSRVDAEARLALFLIACKSARAKGMPVGIVDADLSHELGVLDIDSFDLNQRSGDDEER